MLHKIVKGLAPVAALALGALASGCDGVNITIGDTEGVPLAELDMSGDPPTGLVLASPDTVVVAQGDELDIDVSGNQDIVDAMRFTLEDGTLGIMREKGDYDRNGTATVRVTMPSLEDVTLAGSGSIEAAMLSGNANVTVAGSGKVRTDNVAANSLDMTVAGSGTYEARGTADRLDLTIAGSGSSKMAGLKVERADVNIAGSGDARFASDGRVEANIVGSGKVDVIGRARCEINALGSGSLNCRESGEDDWDEGAASEDAPAD